MQTKIKNKIGTFFGPSGISSGWAFMIAGIVICRFSFFGIILIIAGTFLAFSSSSVLLDTKNKRIKPINTLFEIFTFGKWIMVDNDMHLSVKPNNMVYRTYSRSNRHSDSKTNNFSIVLYSQKKTVRYR